MLCVHAGHVDIAALLVVHRGGFGHCLVHPLGEVGIGCQVDILVLESVANLNGSNLLVLCIGVGNIGSRRGHEDSVGELRRTADIAGIQEDVVVRVDVVVHATFDVSAYKVHRFRASVLCIVIVAVFAPIGGVVESGIHKRSPRFAAIFQLCEAACLEDMACVVAIADIAHAQVLVQPLGVCCRAVVRGVYLLTRSINIVVAVVQVHNHILVNTLIVAEVDTCI